MFIIKYHVLLIVMVSCVATLLPRTAVAQTELDAIMMAKNNLCAGAMYGYSSWNNYWEGTYKRDNQNLGTVSTQMFSINGNYGINNRLNIIFGLPYVSNKASQGTLEGLSGLQDLSLWVKWQPIQKDIGKGTFALFALGGFSTPVSNYTPDFLPMSIGLASTNLSARIIADYWIGDFFATVSGTYTYRSNIELDRDNYYTTELHLTNEVNMPDVATLNFRAGYRTHRLIAEAVVNNMTTLGGFDIRKNDMPFASNTMNATTVGASCKYTPKHKLSFVGGANYTVSGRNMGQNTGFYAGAFYVLDFVKREKTAETTDN